MRQGLLGDSRTEGSPPVPQAAARGWEGNRGTFGTVTVPNVITGKLALGLQTKLIIVSLSLMTTYGSSPGETEALAVVGGCAGSRDLKGIGFGQSGSQI